MAFLGTPYRILYEAAHKESGLSLIQVRVLRPGAQIIFDGPFAMTELPAPFQGRYFYDYANDDTFPQGDYFAFISSPMDATFTTFRFELYEPWATAVDVNNLSNLGPTVAAFQNAITTFQADLTSIGQLVALIPQLIPPGNNPVLGFISAGPTVLGFLDEEQETPAYISNPAIIGYVSDLETDSVGLVYPSTLEARVSSNDEIT